jgi:hypothetical protein
MSPARSARAFSSTGFHERKIPEPEAASADQLDLTDP